MAAAELGCGGIRKGGNLRPAYGNGTGIGRKQSGGERQRAAIARALVANPDIVLADEPTGNLDMENSRAICALLHEMNESERTAMLVVTHDPMVAACAQTVHFLKDGRIADSRETRGDASRVAKLYLEMCR